MSLVLTLVNATKMRDQILVLATITFTGNYVSGDTLDWTKLISQIGAAGGVIASTQQPYILSLESQNNASNGQYCKYTPGSALNNATLKSYLATGTELTVASSYSSQGMGSEIQGITASFKPLQ